MDLFMLGAFAMGCLVAALFFLKFYVQTRDVLFLMFSIAFVLEGANRTGLAFMRLQGEGDPSLYLIRLIAYLVILAGIINKNLKSQDPP